MRLVRTIIGSLVLIALGSPVWSHGTAEELGHHWDMPVYRVEMLTQILIMACISIIAFGGLLFRKVYRRRRTKQ